MKNGIARHTGIEGGKYVVNTGNLTNLEILGDTENVSAKECKSIRLVGLFVCTLQIVGLSFLFFFFTDIARA